MKKQLVLVVMDGIGEKDSTYGNAVKNAYTPNLDYLKSKGAYTTIKAHGTAVGLPSDDDMGNSEVGHNAIGCGQVYSQGAKLVNESIESGLIFKSETWMKLVENAKGHTFHFIGLLSDGNVHSNISHLKAMIKQLKQEGVEKVRLHILLDGRDVPEGSSSKYVSDIEEYMSDLNDDSFDARIASGGGRMYMTMDRYEADWQMVKRGWDAHVHGIGRKFDSALQAIKTYQEEENATDQLMHEFIICQNGEPVGKIQDHDSVVYFNFRGDRALEISRVFDSGEEFDKFDRGIKPEVLYAGMLQYDADLKIPQMYLAEPPKIADTMSEYLVKYQVKTYAISETQKFGHVTYFWNGNRSEKFSEELETWVEIPSDVIPFDQRPWMKSAQITDELIKAIESEEYSFLRCNYPNGDMVGHTGDYESTIIGVEAVDIALGRIIKACEKADATLIVTADHGNADEMYDKKKNENDPIKPKTSHTLNPVPFIIYNSDVKLKEGNYGLSNIAATVFKLLDLDVPETWDEAMI